jgi:hypothetical protein
VSSIDFRSPQARGSFLIQNGISIVTPDRVPQKQPPANGLVNPVPKSGNTFTSDQPNVFGLNRLNQLA